MAIALLRRFNAYRAHPDPAVAAANTLALVLAGDGPFYPLYLYGLVGRQFWPSLLDLWVVPIYALLPALARTRPRAARLVLMGASIANTVLYALLFGAAAQFQLFLLPCISLGLLFHPSDRWRARALAGLALVLFVWLRRHAGAALAFSAANDRAIAALNEISVATLTWFLLVLFGSLALSAGAARPPRGNRIWRKRPEALPLDPAEAEGPSGGPGGKAPWPSRPNAIALPPPAAAST